MDIRKEAFGLHPMLRRNIGVSQSFLEENPSLKTDPPPDDSFFCRAFKENLSIAEDVLKTDYLQAMVEGTLPPDNYGQLTVLDAYYCYRAADSYNVAMEKAAEQKQPPIMYGMLKTMRDHYIRYNSTFSDYWHICSSESVTPTDAFKNYADHEYNVAKYRHPIYTFVAMLPCYYLWYWFSSNMKSQMTPDNPYYPWVEGCAEYPNSAYMIGHFIKDWMKSKQEFDETYAKEIYRQSMFYELRVFTDAFQKK